VGSERRHGRWPCFWSSKEGMCPFIQPRNTEGVKHYARPNVLTENKDVGNKDVEKTVGKVIREQPASGVVNSANLVSAIRSGTTCGSRSNVTSTHGGIAGTINLPSRHIRDLKSRLTTVGEGNRNMESALVKRRKVETLAEQYIAKKKKEKREGYCENCKDKYDDYDEVFPS
jgi:hypothetical protein